MTIELALTIAALLIVTLMAVALIGRGLTAQRNAQIGKPVVADTTAPTGGHANYQHNRMVANPHKARHG